MDYKQYIRDIPDFPKPGILFRDITPLLQKPEAFNSVIDSLCERTLLCGADAVVGVESRGFIFGSPIANKLGLPFIPVRKPGKLPAKTISIEYSLEYGTSQLDIHLDAVMPHQKVVIVDDLLATGGTAKAAAELVKSVKGEIAGMLFVIELGFLNGRGVLSEYNVQTLVRYD